MALHVGPSDVLTEAELRAVHTTIEDLREIADGKR
jgi:hypothetical protein